MNAPDDPPWPPETPQSIVQNTFGPLDDETLRRYVEVFELGRFNQQAFDLNEIDKVMRELKDANRPGIAKRLQGLMEKISARFK